MMKHANISLNLGEPHPDPERPGCWRVPVTSRLHRMEAIIDEESLPLVQGKRWHWSPGKPNRPNEGSVVLAVAATPKTSLARIVLGVLDPDLLVSHVNGDKLDCRRENLIVRTRSEVAQARKPSQETIARLQPYPDPDRPGVWRVPLKSYLAHREALIDEADLPIVKGKNWNWSTRTDGKTEGTVVLATTGRQLPLHRLITGITDPAAKVSFVNGDALDCRRQNLIVRTLAEVCRTSRKMEMRVGRQCTSKFKGVSWDEPRGMWLVQIRRGRVYAHVGRFDDEISAARAYDAAARLLFGENPYLNFPDQPSTEQSTAEARTALDSAVNRTRAQRLRQRDIERQLCRANTSIESKPLDQTRENEIAMISQETAQQLFDVGPCVWQRWHHLNWLPEIVVIEGRAMYRLIEVERLLLQCGIVALPYPDPQQPGVYRVPLSGETAEGREALIDADAVPLVQTRRWRFAESDAGRGGEVQTMIPSEKIRLHYVVMGISANAEEFHIGHRNDNPLDCRRANLVVRTLTETRANQRKQLTWCGRPCTSRFKGVHWDKRREVWGAKIKKEGVSQWLGSFDSEIAAAFAYDEAARELFGEHARLNFPDGNEQTQKSAGRDGNDNFAGDPHLRKAA